MEMVKLFHCHLFQDVQVCNQHNRDLAKVVPAVIRTMYARLHTRWIALSGDALTVNRSYLHDVPVDRSVGLDRMCYELQPAHLSRHLQVTIEWYWRRSSDAITSQHSKWSYSEGVYPVQHNE